VRQVGRVCVKHSGPAAWYVYPVAGTGTAAGSPIAGIRKFAAVQRQAATANTVREACAKAFEHRNLLIDSASPPGRKLSPVRRFRYPVLGQLGQLPSNLLQCQPDLLGEDDEGDSAKRSPRVAAMPRGIALGVNQAPFLVEA
jgi:hypothetical protein